MCRWIAYTGKPITMDTLVTLPVHSLVAQSLNAKMHYKPDGSLDTTNGDGFGVGWYMDKAEPGLFKIESPAWGNENIHELCAQIKSRLFMAHIRAASTGAVQRTNSHPFKYKNWLFQHNGRVIDFPEIRRGLQFDIAPELYGLLKGTTDSETLFFLALTYGLETNPKQAIERMIARVERACKDKGIAVNFSLSCALSDGQRLYAVRYANGAQSNSQYYSTHADCMRDEDADSAAMPRGSVVIVSEPLDHTGEHWTEMPNGSFATIKDGRVDITALAA